MNSYDVLGVPSTASDDEIKKAYRKLAKEYHPDRNHTEEAENKFKAIGEAYSELSDPQRRQDLDAMLHFQNSDRRFQSRGDPIFDHFFRNGNFGGFEDIFGMGGLGPRHHQKRTASVNVTLSLEEAYKGIKQHFSIDHENIEIYIPPGVQSGETLQARVDNTLEVHINIRIRPHKTFERKGNNLYTRLDVPLNIAISGGEIIVKNIAGENINLRIPKGLNSHTKLRIKGAGMILSNGVTGDAYYEAKIIVPTLGNVQCNLIAGILGKAYRRAQSDS